MTRSPRCAMTVLVVDASVLVVDASVLVVALGDDGPDGDLARERLRGHGLVAPELIDLEVASVLRRQYSRGRLDDRRARQALNDLEAIPVRRASHRSLLSRCWELRDNLTVYDAAYVALAEALHAKVRRELWAYAKDEDLDNEGLIGEQYRGVRPAPGYPACPDHSEKEKIFRLLDAPGRIGVHLTENFAMWPASSVSGYYFGHPESKYFVVGKLGKDQVSDYARRKGIDLEAAEKFLRPNLGY